MTHELRSGSGIRCFSWWRSEFRAIPPLAGYLLLLTFSFSAPLFAQLPDIVIRSIDGVPTKLTKYAGQVILISNTASKCGYTPQYHDLEKLYEQYRDSGLVVLGFPSNDFGEQEPGSNQEKDRESDKESILTARDFRRYSHARNAMDDWAEQFAQLAETPSDVTVQDSLPVTLSIY